VRLYVLSENFFFSVTMPIIFQPYYWILMACHNSDCKTVHAFLYFAVIYPVTLHVASAVNRIFSYVNRVIFCFRCMIFGWQKIQAWLVLSVKLLSSPVEECQVPNSLSQQQVPVHNYFTCADQHLCRIDQLFIWIMSSISSRANNSPSFTSLMRTRSGSNQKIPIYD